MRYIYTSEQAKEIDQHSIYEMGFPSLVLMEKAAMSVAAVIMEKIEKERSVVCVCGMGNNGGDGVAVARLLKQAGYEVYICMVGEPERMSEETSCQVKMARNCNVKFIKAEAIVIADVIVDALFGIGLSKAVNGVFETVIDLMNQSGGVVFSIDIPSGVHGSTGEVMGKAVHANETITFGVHKLGLILYPGADFAGQIHVADIGFPLKSVVSVTNPVYMYEPEDLFRMPFRPNHSHKGTFGKVLVIAGSETMSGAAFFAAKAAYTMGAGLVKILSTENNRNLLLGQLPEALFVGYNDLEACLEWADVIVMGPGMGESERSQQTVSYVLRNTKLPTVLDGDGITLAKGELLHSNVVLTPHLLEMVRFTELSMEQVCNNLLDTARSVAEQRECVVVLKDSRTVVSDGSERYLNVSGNNGMATGGSGDVLAGIIGGLLAGGMEVFEAAKLGVYLHGLAGDEATAKKGAYAVMASDILEGLWNI